MIHLVFESKKGMIVDMGKTSGFGAVARIAANFHFVLIFRWALKKAKIIMVLGGQSLKIESEKATSDVFTSM